MSRFRLQYDRNRYSNARRTIIRRLLQRYLRTVESSFRFSGDLPRAEIRRILICRPNHRLGNLLLLTPLIIETQRAFPGAEIDIVTAGEAGSELFCALPNVRHVYGLPRRMVRTPISTVRTALRIRRARYDLAIDPCEASQSSRFLLVLAKATHAIGVPAGGADTHSNWAAAMAGPPAHAAKLPVFLLRNALSQNRPKNSSDYPSLDIGLTAEERRRGRQCLDSLMQVQDKSRVRLVVGVFLNATGSKRYDTAWWFRFMEEILRRHPDRLIVEISPPDGPPRLALNVASYSSTSPRKVAAFISNLACFVSADCGVMHLACASGTPTIGLFSVSDPSKYAPYGQHNQAILTDGRSPEEVAQMVNAIVEAGYLDELQPAETA